VYACDKPQNYRMNRLVADRSVPINGTGWIESIRADRRSSAVQDGRSQNVPTMPVTPASFSA